MRVRWGFAMLSVKCLSRNASNVFYDSRCLSVAYCKIFGHQKPRNDKKELYFDNGCRFFTKHGFVYAQNKAHARLKIVKRRNYKI